MSADINALLDQLLKVEGGYTNDPSDRGGETNFGITVGTARANGYNGAMRDMPVETAKAIYRLIYWERPGFVGIATIAPRVAAKLFDMGVNMGPAVAANFLQRSLNALNRSGSDYPDISPLAPRVGPQTTAALNGFMRTRPGGETILLRALDALQGEKYIRLAETNPKDEKFLYGWLANRIENVA